MAYRWQAARLHLPLSLRVFQSLLFLLVTEATFPIIQVYKIKESKDSKGDFKGEPATAVSPDAVAPSSAGEPRKVATKRAAFVAPSLEMVKDYFLTIKGANTDSECCYDYFTANGWRTGKNPIKDWKAAARNWMRRKSEFSNTTQIQTSYETKRIYKDL